MMNAFDKLRRPARHIGRRLRGSGGLVWAVFLLSGLSPSTAQKVPVQETLLSNGMRLLLVERHDDPSVAGGWVAHVGSANERPGMTGMAHLFEHMMFKGTPSIGTKDYPRDLAIIAEQETIRQAMREEERHMRQQWRLGQRGDWQQPEHQTDRYRDLQKRFQELIADQRQILVRNEFDRLYITAGASGMDAFTTHDLTGYFITLPANKLELWMWMESERILRPVFREFYSERDVVFEERRLRTESTPLGKFEEAFQSMIWTAHPYHWPVLGWASDIPAISKAEADAFYGVFYAPQNITLVLVGDLDVARAAALARAYFERIPRGGTDPPEVITLEPTQLAERRMYAQAEANPQVEIAWHTAPFGHPDTYPLMLLGQILSTRTGRLYKGLVLGTQVATTVYAGQLSRKWAGTFEAGGEARQGHSPEEVETGIYREIEKLLEREIPAEELQKVKNNFAAYEYRRLTSNMSILMQLLNLDGYGHWPEINEAGPKYQAVTAEDIQRVARLYLRKENRNVAVYTRKEESKR